MESQRRGTLVILMSDIMNQMNEEINEQKKEGKLENYSLSEPLIGRIAALSQGLLPYKMYQADTLSKKEYSPERGQLFFGMSTSEK